MILFQQTARPCHVLVLVRCTPNCVCFVKYMDMNLTNTCEVESSLLLCLNDVLHFKRLVLVSFLGHAYVANNGNQSTGCLRGICTHGASDNIYLPFGAQHILPVLSASPDKLLPARTVSVGSVRAVKPLPPGFQFASCCCPKPTARDPSLGG